MLFAQSGKNHKTRSTHFIIKYVYCAQIFTMKYIHTPFKQLFTSNYMYVYITHRLYMYNILYLHTNIQCNLHACTYIVHRSTTTVPCHFISLSFHNCSTCTTSQHTTSCAYYTFKDYSSYLMHTHVYSISML